MAVTALVIAFPAPILAFFGLPGGQTPEITALRLNALSFPLTAVVFLLMYLYMALSKKGMAALIAVLNGLALTVPAAWLMSGPMGLGINGVWFSAAVAGALTLAAVGLVVLIRRARDREQNPDFFLLPYRAPEELYALSAPATAESAAGVGALLERALISDGMEQSAATRLAYVAEGTVENIALPADVQAMAEDVTYANLLGWNRLTILVRRNIHGTVEAR